MAARDIIPDRNVLVSDIRDTLNAHGSSCNNSIITLFNEKAKINHWSFRKPYATDLALFKLTDEQIKSSDINCGLSPYLIEAYTLLPDMMDGNMNGWEYNRPFGDETSPYRLGDYVGYLADAPPMILDFYVPEYASNLFEGNAVSATAIVSIPTGYNVTLSHLANLKYYYPAVFLKQVNGTQSRRYTSTSNFEDDGAFSVTIPVDDLNTGEWTVYPFLAENQIPEDYDVPNTYYTIPNVTPLVINIIETDVKITVTAEKIYDGSNTITWTVYANNFTSSDKTFNTNFIAVRYSGYDFSHKYEAGEVQMQLSDGLVAKANSTTALASGVFENVSTEVREWDDEVNTSVWDSPKIWASLNTGNYIGEVIPISQDPGQTAN